MDYFLSVVLCGVKFWVLCFCASGRCFQRQAHSIVFAGGPRRFGSLSGGASQILWVHKGPPASGPHVSESELAPLGPHHSLPGLFFLSFPCALPCVHSNLPRQALWDAVWSARKLERGTHVEVSGAKCGRSPCSLLPRWRVPHSGLGSGPGPVASSWHAPLLEYRAHRGAKSPQGGRGVLWALIHA